MEGELPPHDPRAAHRWEVIAARRVGRNRQCPCGESRPEALVPGTTPTTCTECERESQGRKRSDIHHVFGKANSPFAMSIPANDHRASLNISQRNWPRKTLVNEQGSPLLAAAAKIRGFSDFIFYMIKEHLLPIAVMLELLDTMLERKLGKSYWKKTKLKAFEPKAR